MAIRVRKLARQLAHDPAHLLGVLHAIGIQRYRSPEDMLSSPVEAKLRKALAKGVKPVQLELKAVRKKPLSEPAPALPPQAERLTRTPVTPPAVDPPAPPPPRGLAEPIPPPPEVDATARLLDALQQEREALAAERDALASLRDALQPSADTPPAAHTTLQQLLDARGLVGADEAERAMRALAEKRRLVEFLPYLTVSDPAAVSRLLGEILVLVDGQIPEVLTSEAAVTVAAERAEVPGAAAFRKYTGQLSEALMLNGARRVVIVGGPIRLHRLLANAFDPRIELRFRPATRVRRSDAETDVTRTDAVVLWNVEVDAEAHALYAQGGSHVTTVTGGSLVDLFKTWQRALTA